MYSSAMRPTVLEFPYLSTSTKLLDGEPADYVISSPNVAGVIVTITRVSTGLPVYIGPGPVKVFVSPAPF